MTNILIFLILSLSLSISRLHTSIVTNNKYKSEAKMHIENPDALNSWLKPVLEPL